MTTIELKGDLSVNNAEDMHNVFISAVQKKSPIELDCSQLEDIDTSIIQLLYALFKEQTKERPITIKGPIENTVKKRLFATGILPAPDLSDDQSIEIIQKKLGGTDE